MWSNTTKKYQTPFLAIREANYFNLFFLGFLSTFAEKWPLSILQPKIGVDIFMNIPFNGVEGDFKDTEAPEFHESDQIFEHRNW